SGANLQITTNGGATWTPTPPLVDNPEKAITAFQWINDTRFLLGTTDGRVFLFDHPASGKPNLVWSSTIGRGAIQEFQIDGDYSWVRQKNLVRFKIDNGKLDATIAIDSHIQIQDWSVCHGHVLIMEWQTQKRNLPTFSIDDWAREPGKDYKFRKSI